MGGHTTTRGTRSDPGKILQRSSNRDADSRDEDNRDEDNRDEDNRDENNRDEDNRDEESFDETFTIVLETMLENTAMRLQR